MLLFFFSEEESGKWILCNVVPKLQKWFDEMDQCDPSGQSLRLVSFEAYNELYQQLKEKYVKNITAVSIQFQILSIKYNMINDYGILGIYTLPMGLVYELM